MGCHESKFYDVILTPYNFRQQNHAEIGEGIAKAAAAGMGVIAMKAMGGCGCRRGRKNPRNPFPP